MINLDALSKLVELGLSKVEQENIERLTEIKILVKGLMKKAFEQKDAASYAAIMQKALTFIEQAKDHRLDYLASVFEIAHDEMDVAHYALDKKGGLLTWLVCQHHDLLEFAQELEVDPKTIQPFLNEVVQHLGFKQDQVMPPKDEILLEVGKSYDQENLKRLHLYADLCETSMKHAFKNNQPKEMAALIKGIMPTIQKSIAHGRYELIQNIFDLNSDDIAEIYSCHQQKAMALVHWLLVDHLGLESYAKEMPVAREDVQGFKQAVLAELGFPKAVRPASELGEHYQVAASRGDEDALNTIFLEGTSLLKQGFLDNDIKTSMESIEMVYQQLLLAFGENDYKSIAEALEINADDMDELLSLLAAGDREGVLYFIIQNEDFDEMAFKSSIQLDQKDAKRTVAFKDALYKVFNAGGSLTAAPQRLTLTVEQIGELIQTTLAAPTTDKLDYLIVKLGQSLQDAYQQNRLDEYLAINTKLVEVSALLLENDVETLLTALELPSQEREKFLVYLQRKAFAFCSAILLQDDIKEHNRFQYSLHEEQKDFEKRALEKLEVTSVPEIDVTLTKDDEGHYENDKFIEYWTGQIPALSKEFKPEDCFQFRMQFQQRLSECFKKEDLDGYVEAMQMFNQFAEDCLKAGNVAALAYLLAKPPAISGVILAGGDSLEPIIATLKSGNVPYMQWLMVEQHNFDNDCVISDKKYGEVGPFKNRVYKRLGIDTKQSFRSLDTIASELRDALGKNETERLDYLSFEMENLLKQTIYSNDAKSSATVLDVMADIADEANKMGRFDRVSSFLGLWDTEIPLIKQLLDQDRKDLLKIAIINSPELNKTIHQVGDDRATISLRNGIINNLTIETPQVFASPGKLKRLIMDAVSAGNAAGLKLLAYECQQLTRHAFLSKDTKMLTEFNQMFLEVIEGAIAKKRTDLVIEHFELNNEYVELISLIREKLAEKADAAEFKNLCYVALIQNLDLEKEGAYFNIKDEDIQNFKKQVHAAHMGVEGANLLCDLDRLTTFGETLIGKSSVGRLEGLLFNAHLDSHLEYAFEQKDPKHYAVVLNRVYELTHKAFTEGNINILLENIDLKFNYRDALLHQLTYKDKEGALQVLTEALLENSQNDFTAKFGYRYAPEFRVNIYEELDVPPIEFRSVENKHTIPGITPILLDQRAREHMDWLQKKGDSIDLEKEFDTTMLINIARHDLASSAIYFLKGLNTEKSLKLADALKLMNLEHKLCHRMGLTGARDIEDISFKVEGGSEADMVEQLKIAYPIFYEYEKLDMEQFTGGALGVEIDADATCKNIVSDLKSVSMRNNGETVTEALAKGQVVNIPVSLKCGQDPNFDMDFEYHAVNVCFFKDYCLVADRSRPGMDQEQGVRIFKVKNPDNLKAVCNQFNKAVTSLGFPVEHEQFDDYLIKELGLEQVGHMEQLEQTAGSCTWSSCAEMMHLSTAFARLLEQAEAKGVTTREAIEKSSKAALTLHQHFNSVDLGSQVSQYIQFAKQTKLDVSPKTLSLIYLRCEHAPNSARVLEQIQGSGLVDEKSLQEARAHLLSDIKTKFIPIALRDNQEKAEEVDAFAVKILDLFLHQKYDDAKVLYAEFVEPYMKETGKPESPTALVSTERPSMVTSFTQRRASAVLLSTDSGPSDKKDEKPERPKQ